MKKLFSLLLVVSFSLSSYSQTKTPCKGKTKAGAACKSVMVNKATGYCFSHDPITAKCGTLTTSGKPCQVPVKVKGSKCRFHK